MIMDEIIKGISDITKELKQALTDENYELFLNKLDERYVLMEQAEAYKNKSPESSYSPAAIQLLEETVKLDRSVAEQLKENMNKTHSSLMQLKQKRQVSMKYQPYSKQTNGIFVDYKN